MWYMYLKFYEVLWVLLAKCESFWKPIRSLTDWLSKQGAMISKVLENRLSLIELAIVIFLYINSGIGPPLILVPQKLHVISTCKTKLYFAYMKE